MMIVLDAHQDIAYNYLKYGRDYRRSALVTRTQEPAGTEAATIGLPEALAGRVALIFSTPAGLIINPLMRARCSLC